MVHLDLSSRLRTEFKVTIDKLNISGPRGGQLIKSFCFDSFFVDNSMVVIASLVTACIRSLTTILSKVAALELLDLICQNVEDEYMFLKL